MARTTVVTVTYNSQDTIGAMLEALRPARAAGVIEIVIVDNASRDGTLAALAPYERDGVCRVVSAGGNIGFGRGCNLGAAHAHTEFVLFLNPDARLEPEAIHALEQALDDHPDVDVAAPAIQEEDGQHQPVGALPSALGLIFERSPLHNRFFGSSRPTPGAGPSPTTWVSGAAFMCRREAFNALGGFDPRFFLYYEESDLFRRLLKRGRRILVVPRAICHHIGGHSAQTVQAGRIGICIAEHFIRSRNWYARKHFGAPVMWAADLAFFLTLWFRAVTSPRPADRVTWQARRGVGLFVLPSKPPSTPAGGDHPTSPGRPGVPVSDALETSTPPGPQAVAPVSRSVPT
jgi:GT2 family glycosyltransferase